MTTTRFCFHDLIMNINNVFCKANESVICFFLLYTVNNVVPALLAGNSILLKQSPQTPKCADLFVETFHEAGVPKQVIQVMHTDDKGADYLVQHPGIHYVSFTGSIAIGKTIRKAIGNSENSLSIGLGMELGGKDPAYVLPDCDLDFAVENIIDGAFFNTGQCCCSIERCYVHADIYEEFLQKAVAIAQVNIYNDYNAIAVYLVRYCSFSLIAYCI